MGHIKNIRIKGFKKFSDFSVDFNRGVNILVGNNEAGKSTIIEAIDILINKTYENFDKYILGELFHQANVKSFLENPTFENLPKISICGEFELHGASANEKEFYGVNWLETDKKTSKYGILFECSIDNEYRNEVMNLISQKIIPYEYYSLRWTTFKNEPYNKLRKALSFVPIDVANNTTYNSLDFYSKRLFQRNNIDSIAAIKTNFRTEIDKKFKELGISSLEGNRRFGLNHKKLILENIVGILDEDVLIENKGKGQEKIIKTSLSIDKKSLNDVIAIEEPENNLSHTSLRKMIKIITEKRQDKQLIITTHNSLIVSGLSLKNVIWIANSAKKTLGQIDSETAEFFTKLESDNLLRFILAKKVILVEGPSEKLMVPHLFSNFHENTGESLELYEIDVISCNGLSYKRYLEIARLLGKRVAVLTDNDKSQTKIDKITAQNLDEENPSIKIFIPNDPSEFTWEVCLKNRNKELVERVLKIMPGAKYTVNGEELEDKVLAYMLLHKVDASLKLINSNERIVIPAHLESLFTWIKK